ncbi:hypothetical protein POM88_027800 [Heracleum sosnowskyi]|uniref:J domain-containing protein n=1 Tax=Heracleum sosnowskyi TaxID=360622 RepID=A0AAD8I9N7_9APIA|nr:hypothetical protein POM88_027800 [Heracleum sosnowskyi]
MDYYKILEVDRNATKDDLKKAYLKLGLEEFDDTKFKILTQAFDVLGHPKRRAAYDLQYGEEGLKGVPPQGEEGLKSQVPPRGAGSDGPNTDRFNSQVSPRGAGSDGLNMDSQVPPRGAASDGPNMDRFNGQVPPQGAGSDRPNMERSNGRSPFDIFQEFFGSSVSPFGNMPKRKRKGAPIERTLPSSLEELYNGTTKRMKISRNVTDATEF